MAKLGDFDPSPFIGLSSSQFAVIFCGGRVADG